jgi:hypothetical protein
LVSALRDTYTHVDSLWTSDRECELLALVENGQKR